MSKLICSETCFHAMMLWRRREEGGGGGGDGHLANTQSHFMALSETKVTRLEETACRAVMLCLKVYTGVPIFMVY